MLFTSNQAHDQNITVFSESLTGAIKLKYSQR
ncbi:hypothetical protein MOC98_20980, partial [Bacillus spizizenii]|nr:hypothetical protein [Bacillus spizizenii]